MNGWSLALVVLGLCGCAPAAPEPAVERSPPRVIAHAGGEVNGNAYTNSLQALDAAYARGVRHFELDFSWTRDGHAVLIHDWQGMWAHYFGAERGQVPTLREFLARPMAGSMTPLSMDQLEAWLEAHAGAQVITDTKSDNPALLRRVADSPLRQRFIPQVYDFEEYRLATSLGFDRIVLTVYRLEAAAAEVEAFARQHAPWAVTVPKGRLRRGEFADLLRAASPPVYAHTVNEPEEWAELARRGVFGIYTDALLQVPPP